jgi:hypothetical protein
MTRSKGREQMNPTPTSRTERIVRPAVGPNGDGRVSSLEARPARAAMKALAIFRIALGMFAWFAPRTVNRLFSVPRADDSPALIYMNRVFGVRAVSLGVGYLASDDKARRLWHRLWLLCDAADTAMGAVMMARGELPPLTAVQALAITGGATAIDLAAMAQPAAAAG